VSSKRPLICSKSFAILATKERYSLSGRGIVVAKFHQTPTKVKTERKIT
jgi:hypothetical protein